MCIIIAKKAGIDMPGKEMLRDCFAVNGDGAGFMYNNGYGKVNVSKGYMDVGDLLDGLKTIPDAKLKDVVIHFRFATSGVVNSGNTHPYPLSPNVADLTTLDTVCDSAICHNGILPDSLFNEAELKVFSDTLLFVRDLAKGTPLSKVDDILTLAAKKTRSRFVSLNHKLTMYGDGWINDDGLWLSNENYLLAQVGYMDDRYYSDRYYTDHRHDDSEACGCKLCYGTQQHFSGWRCVECGSLESDYVSDRPCSCKGNPMKLDYYFWCTECGAMWEMGDD